MIRRTSELRTLLAQARSDSVAFRARATELLASMARSREFMVGARESCHRDPASVAYLKGSPLAAQYRQVGDSAARVSAPSRDGCEVVAASPDGYQRTDRLLRQMSEMRRQAAVLARIIARTEEEVAATFEDMARTRPSADAGRLRSHAARARQFAAEERARADG